MDSLKRAKETLVKNEYTCVLCKGEEIFYSDKRGVKPLVDFYETNKFELIPEGVDLEDCYGVCFNAYFDDFENAKIEADIVVNTIDSRKFMFSIGLSGFFDPTLHK